VRYDAGLTPVTIIGQHVGGELRIFAAMHSERAGTRQHLENVVRPWFAVNAPWALRSSSALRHFVDPSMNTPGQADIETSPVRVLRELLGGIVREGPTSWPGRRDPMLAVFNRLNPATGRPVLQLDPEDAAMLDRALSGRWFYRVVRGQVSRELPDKRHPWSDLGDAFAYLVAGAAPTASMSPRRQREVKTNMQWDPLDYERNWRQR
jgi:hypothetical protein